MSLHKPWRYYHRLCDIPISELRRQQVNTVLLDMDNTVVPWHTVEISPENMRWLEELKQCDMRIFLFSNNNRVRTALLAKKMDVHFISNALKPWGRGFRELARVLKDYSAGHCVLIGDQIMTDVVGGNRHGIRTILVDPITARESFWTRRMRTVERTVFKRQPQREGL